MLRSPYILFLLFTAQAFGWGDLGHQTVAEIAERNLSDKAKAMVFDILGPEPLATAAIYPDLVRPDHRFDPFPNYHFLDIPPGLSIADAVKAQAHKKTADTILSKVPTFLTQKAATRNQKMILLRYLVHVVGDVHQPLHLGNGVDGGGNLCEVNWIDATSGQIQREVLHWVWDDRIFDYERSDFKKSEAFVSGKKHFFTYQDAVETALATGQTEKVTEKMKEAPLLEWYQESKDLHPLVYPDSKPGTKPEARPYCKTKDLVTGKAVPGAFDPKQIPTLDEAYARKALAIANRRLVLAGFRLAEVLNSTAKSYPLAKTNPKAFSDLVESVQLER